MEVWKVLMLVVVEVVGLVFMQGRESEGRLVENFYSSTCPKVESIVKQAVTLKVQQSAASAPGTLRLFFHDCMVEGCDASIMIASANGDAEKDFTDNLSLAGDGFDTVIKAKQAVEAQCPGVVSCADILALAARDVVFLAGGPAFNVELGRRDGLVSKASRVAGNLPEPTFNLNQLNTMFAKHNLTQTDVIALSGAHTLGFAHCDRFSDRLYSFPSSSGVDPSLDSNFAQILMITCPQNVNLGIVIPLDPTTRNTFDNAYYGNLVAGQGLLSSDQVLFSDSASQPTVINFANNPDNFNGAFITAMRKLGRVGVKTGNQGEIRRDCATFNS